MPYTQRGNIFAAPVHLCVFLLFVHGIQPEYFTDYFTLNR